MKPDSRDIFWERTKKTEVTRAKIKLIILVCGANMSMLLLYAWGFDSIWWANHPMLFIFLAFIYLLNIIAYNHASEDSTLFSDTFNKFKCWRDFYTSKAFVKSREDYKHVPIKNGDYLLLWHGEDVEYMKYVISYTCIGRDIDLNNIYNIDIFVKDAAEETILYHSKKHHYFWCLTELLFEIQQELESDGYIIKEVINKFGDVRWRQSDNPKPPQKIKKYLYNILVCTWYFLCFIAAIAPIATPIHFFLNIQK